MQPRIIVTGVPAVGKTSLVNHVRVPQEMISVKNYGNLMASGGKRLGVISRSEELETLSLDERARLQAEAARLVDEEASTMPVLLDGHLVVDTKSGFVPGLPLSSIGDLKLTAILLLVAEPNEIIERRKYNRDKYSMLVSTAEHIEDHQRVFYNACVHYALVSHASLEILRNPQNQLDATVDRFLDFISNLVPGIRKP